MTNPRGRLQRLVRLAELQCARTERHLSAARARTAQAANQLASLQAESSKLLEFDSVNPLALKRRADWLCSLEGAVEELQAQVERLQSDEAVYLAALGEARASKRAYDRMQHKQALLDRKVVQRRERAQTPTILGISTTLRLDNLEIDNDDTF